MVSKADEVVAAFNEALNRHDVAGMMALMSEDCLFESTFPAPDGERYEGQEAVWGYWEAFFEASPRAHIAVEELFVAGERVVQRWVYRWVEEDGTSGHVRGVDLFRVREGRIAEKLAYVKG